MASRKTKGTAESPVFVKCDYSYILGEHTCVSGQSVFKKESGDQIDEQTMKVCVAREHAGGNSIRFKEFDFGFISEAEFKDIENTYKKEAAEAEDPYSA